VTKDQRCVVVCDGVGGWTKKDEHPELVSKHIATSVGKQFEAHQSGDHVNLREMLVEAARTNTDTGSTTAVIVSIEENSNSTARI